MARETKEAYWVLWDKWENEGLDRHWNKFLSEENMWKFVASFTRSAKNEIVFKIIKGKPINIALRR